MLPLPYLSATLLHGPPHNAERPRLTLPGRVNTFISATTTLATCDPSAMTSTTAQPATAQPSAQPGEPSFLLSGSASECLAQLADRFPHLLTAAQLGGLPAKLPATRGYDFRNPRLLSEVLDRLCSDLKLPALAKVSRDWQKLRALPQAAVLSASDWSKVLAGRAQLASPARYARHGHALESWDSPWVQAERAAAFWGPARCCRCAVAGCSPSSGRLFYFPHEGDCEPQCSGKDGRCGSPLCNGCCIGCVRGREECSGVCGAGGPCSVFIEDSPGSDDGVWVDPDAQPGKQALTKPPAPAPQPTKPQPGPSKPKPTAHAAPSPELLPAAPAALPVAPSLPTMPTDDAKRLAQPLAQSPTVKPVRSTVRKPLDVGAALAALRK